MISALLLALFICAGIYAVRTYVLKKQVSARVQSLSAKGEVLETGSILKKAESTKFSGRVLSRLDALFSRRDKLLLALCFVCLPWASYFFMTALDSHWRLLIGFVAVFTLVGVLFLIRKQQQSEEFEQSIVQVLGMISRAVSAGLSVPQAISQVAHSQKGLLGREFSLIEDQLSLGRGLRFALDEACVRMPYKAFRYFSIALILNQSNGGQLREILHNLSRTLHDNRAMQKKVKSLTSEPRMTARFLAILPLILLAIIAWINPSMFQLLVDTESGQSVLAYCALSILIGGISLQMLTKNRRFR
ncbi:type II secretion system F family protein [Vibrio sp. TBV020]|uniref:type II secretion system F family protein n=1 Tax=Vibrio sp. TBV020 TaxID=3137398 RepID=UPI0038CD6A82